MLIPCRISSPAILLMLSNMNMLLLSIDRALTVKWTFLYSGSVNSKQVHYIIVIPWMVTLLYFVILFCLTKIYPTYKQANAVMYISFTVVAVIGFIILIVSTYFIHEGARNQLIAISSSRVEQSGDVKQKERHLKYRECRLAFICIGIVVKFIIFWLPKVISMIYHYQQGKVKYRGLSIASCYLVLVNSICDPVIYVYMSKDIKKQIRHLFCKKQMRTPPAIIDTTCTVRLDLLSLSRSNVNLIV